MFCNIEFDSEYVLVITSISTGRRSPHRLETFSCDKSIIADWLTDFTDTYRTGGAHWLKIGNVIEVYHLGEKIDEISQVPPHVSHVSELKYQVVSWNHYDDCYDVSDFASYPEALKYFTQFSDPGSTLQELHLNGSSQVIRIKSESEQESVPMNYGTDAETVDFSNRW